MLETHLGYKHHLIMTVTAIYLIDNGGSKVKEVKGL